MRRPPPVHEFRPIHTDGRIIGPAPADVSPSRYKNIQQILIGALIVGAVAFMMVGGYSKARRPAYMADCTGRLHVLAQAFEMYAMDHGQYLPAASYWRYAVSDYVDAVGGQNKDLEGAARRAGPRGFSSPMRCLGNHSTNPISYFYLDPQDLAQGPRLGDVPEAPLLIDEVYHPKVIALRQDGSCAQIVRQAWLAERQNTWQVARRPDWPSTYAYMSARPAAMATTGTGGG